MFQTMSALFLSNDLTRMTGHHSPALIFPITLSHDKIAQGVLCLQSNVAEAIACEMSPITAPVHIFCSLEQTFLKTSSVLHRERIPHSTLPPRYKSLYTFVLLQPIRQPPWCCPNWEHSV